MNDFPDHPVITAMERDGQLPDHAEIHCYDCGAPIYDGDWYYRVDGFCYCEGCERTALRHITYRKGDD